ncbi:MAG: hypothetical protein R2728_11535 [Chitinophagales bacterium]
MYIFHKKFDFPKHYSSEAVTIFPTNIEFAASDFKAVMASKDELRLWSDSEWPENNFTVEANKEDLKHHVEDNEAHCAYGFMLYDANRKTCYGSLYVNPINPDSFKNAPSEIAQFDARVDCWIRTDIDETLKIAIVKELKNWLDNEWPIQWGFTARPTLSQYQKLFSKCGLKRSLTLVYKEYNELYLYA